MTKSNSASDARELFYSHYQGILCTHSKDMPGYPFGSVVPYVLDKNGQPIILISSIAQHTHNIDENNKVSIIVTDEADDLQTVGRVTYLGDARKLRDEEEDSKQRYYNYFPWTEDYHKTHDFSFYTIDLQKIRFIGGFGKIYWVDKEEYLSTTPFDREQETGMINHMNEDHVDAMLHYCNQYGFTLEDNESPVMVGVDGEGFHLRVGKRIHRISFSEPVKTPKEVRQQLVKMART